MSDHECPVCGDGFAVEKGVRDHSWDAHDACHHCGEEFADREELYTHWLDDHEADLSAEDRKRAGNRVGDRTVCPACGDRFGSEAGVRDHSWDAHGVCHHCGAEFDDRTDLHAHWLGVHRDDLSREDRRRAENEVGDLTVRQRLAHQGPAQAVTGVSVSRRALLVGGLAGGAGVVGGTVLTGALGGGGGTLEDHPAAAALASQPALGPPPGEGDATIVAFEDPSCPACARFERETFPALKRRLVDPGRASFVFRGVPVVNPWGDPAVLALEATFARSEDAFWALKDRYYRNQGRIDGGNVLPRTRQFLADDTDANPGAVLEDVRRETHRSAVDADLAAFDDAGVRGTPTFFLFRDGSLVTKVVGPESYRTFANALGV